MRITKSGFFGFVLFLFVATSSLYFFDSGGPQIGDPLILVLFASVAIIHFGGLYRVFREDKPVSLMAIMVLWIFLVASLNVIYFSLPEILFPVIFYVFNFMAMASTAVLFSFRPEKTRAYLLAGVYISSVLTFVFVALDAGFSGRRITGPFNNPNQLAYYSICIWVIVLAISPKGKLFRLPNLMVMVFATLFILSSASLTALASVLLLVASTLIRAAREGLKIKYVVLMPFLIAVAIFSVINSERGMNMVNRAIERSDTLESKIANMETSRGYARVFDHPEYLILGVGERGRQRFEFRQEAHSSFVTMIFSYGFVGLSLFISILFFSVWRGPVYLVGALGAILIYSATHNGLRFTLFWIALVCMLQATKEFRLSRRARGEQRLAFAKQKLRKA